MNVGKFAINQTIKIINSKQFAKSWQEYSSGKTHFAELPSSDFEVKEFTTKPLDTYIEPENFPNCCEWHHAIYEQALQKFNEFPSCCENHRPLIDQFWFDKIDYIYLPRKIVNTISYTLHCIRMSSKETEWFKQITDYIDYTVSSYGQFPEGFGPSLGRSHYISAIEQNVLYVNELTDAQKYSLLEYLEKFTGSGKSSKPVDLNQLIDIYKQWIRIFPFEISSLSHLKPLYQAQLPIISKMHRNIYSGLVSSQPVSKEELVKNLTDTTKSILTQLNQLEEFKLSKRFNREKTGIQLANSRHQLKQEALMSEDLSDRTYWKIIKNWLKNEKTHIDELTAILKNDYSTETFILNVIDGMQRLQRSDTNAACLDAVRKNVGNRESQIRHWFLNFLCARYQGSDVTAEESKGAGHIDLKIFHPYLGFKIIEFKGWWNVDKKNVTHQVTKYLTDAEDDGFIFMINHLKKNIVEEYRNLIEKETDGYVDCSWKEVAAPTTAITYFESQYQSATKIKTIYHFIFNAWS